MNQKNITKLRVSGGLPPLPRPSTPPRKPRIQKFAGRWFCGTQPGMPFGVGYTIWEAYDYWLKGIKIAGYNPVR